MLVPGMWLASVGTTTSFKTVLRSFSALSPVERPCIYYMTTYGLLHRAGGQYLPGHLTSYSSNNGKRLFTSSV